MKPRGQLAGHLPGGRGLQQPFNVLGEYSSTTTLGLLGKHCWSRTDIGPNMFERTLRSVGPVVRSQRRGKVRQAESHRGRVNVSALTDNMEIKELLLR
jgi:hypothetical protein